MNSGPQAALPPPRTGRGRFLGAVRRVYLLAEREFAAYVKTATFWIALAVGPVGMVLLLAVSQLTTAPVRVPPSGTDGGLVVEAVDPDLVASGHDAVRALGELSGHLAPSGQVLLAHRQGQLTLEVRPATALTPLERAFILDRVALQMEPRWPSPQTPYPPSQTVRRIGPPAALDMTPLPPPPPASAEASSPARAARLTGRMAVATVLWLTLTGSLGMLLQAVVRERANRGLESLLSVAPPLEIVLGKLIGVGAVSCLVMGTWIGSGAGLASLAAQRGGLVAAALSGLSQPADLAGAAAAFVLAYLTCGLATVAIGSTAGDTAAAQNMSRPLFGVLLVVFIAVMSTGSGTQKLLSWLVFVPPFTPFFLIIGDYTWSQQALAGALNIAAILAAGAAARNATRLRN